MAPAMSNEQGERSATRSKWIVMLLLAAAAVCILTAAAVYLLQDIEGAEAQKSAIKLLEAVEAQQPPREAAAIQVQEEGEAPQRVLNDMADYPVMAKLTIPKLELELPVITECSDEALKVSVCRLTGPTEPGESGLVLTAHNYRNGAHFGRLDELDIGDQIELMDVWGAKTSYRVSDMLHIKPDDWAALNAAESVLDLVTCTNNANARLLVRCEPAAYG